MWTEYTSEINAEDSFYEPPEPAESTSDIQLPPVINTLLLVTWIIIFLVGLVAIYLIKNPLLGALIIAIPTFIGMIIKPTFALCMMMLVLPTGAGVGYSQIFSLNRGVGIALAVSFLLNIMISRPSLRISNKALWVLIIYTVWIFLSTLAAPHAGLEVMRAFTQFQLLVLVFIVYWILQTNGEKTFRWALRAYVIGTLGTIIIAYKSGAAIIAMEEKSGRFTATAGEAIDANMLATLTSMAFFAAIYLLARDRNKLWRIVYLSGILFLPLMLLRTGSRGGTVAMAFTVLSPLLFVRQILRRPALAALLFLVIVFVAGSTAFIVQKSSLEERVSMRLTNIQLAKSSLANRIRFNKAAIDAAAKYPTGTGYIGWFELSGMPRAPHNDFFFALGIHGIPAAVLFASFIIIMILTVKRIPLGLEKLYARAVLTFLLVMGLDIGQLYQKHFWVFMVIIMAAERISWLKNRAIEYSSNEINEETAYINY